MKHQHHARAAVLGAAACAGALLLTACGSGNPPSGGDVTVTVTPTVTAQPPGGSTTSQGPKVPKSDVVGRAFDFGVVTSVRKVGTTTVIELDRWTWKGLDDAKLAKNGVPIAPFKGAPPYENQNAKLTYTIPVADGARVLYHHCIAADQPLQTKTVDPTELKGLADRENTVLVQIDSKGSAAAIENIPGCPG
jgi:hypothetical protein